MTLCFVLIITLFISRCGLCQREMPWVSEDYEIALRNGANAMITLKVTDENGIPLKGAKATISSLPADANSYIKKEYYTNSEGTVVVSEKSIEPIGGYVSMDGYYDSVVKVNTGNPENPYDTKQKVSRGKWIPWNPVVHISLRKVLNPIPMYATTIDRYGIPNNIVIGFDCLAQDWVEPHGTGKIADFLIRFSPLIENDYDGACLLELLPCKQGEGFIRKKKNNNSFFPSEYNAPFAGYQAVHFKRDKVFSVYEKNKSDLQDSDYLIFKSRIVRDMNGKEIGANFGKIYGPLRYKYSKEYSCGMIYFVYYFNAKINDTNLEFDTRHKMNLFGEGKWVMPHPRKP